MRQHGWGEDEWPELFKKVAAYDSIVVYSPVIITAVSLAGPTAGRECAWCF